MKAKTILLATLVAALSFQCSKSADETGEISLPPPKPPLENPDTSPEPTTGVVTYVPTVTGQGFTGDSNARLVVDSLAGTVAPEFDFLPSWLEGRGGDEINSSKVSEILLYENGRVYVTRTHSFSLLWAPDGYGGSTIRYWDLDYGIVQHEGQPDEITITGTGKGSHFYGLVYEPYDAWLASYEAWLTSEITFEFRGVQIEGTNDFQGHFALEEKSPDETYNLFLSGTLTLERDPEKN